jgi:hypothetical protein
MPDLTDSLGAPFVEDALYTDQFGDTFRASFEATEFQLMQKADNSLPPGGSSTFVEAAHLVACYGPLTPAAGAGDPR